MFFSGLAKLEATVSVKRQRNNNDRGKSLMTKSELVELIASKQTQLSVKDVELAVKTVIEHMSQALADGQRIEIRGFGSFSLHHRAARTGRNPKTGEAVQLPAKFVPHFKPGKELREQVNDSLKKGF
ncbi:hypothetical protein GCM10011362_29260 [Marinobacter halophilus]|nr:hypothetical protein GCM10011362_29260 [Marinobacter halophilus]